MQSQRRRAHHRQKENKNRLAQVGPINEVQQIFDTIWDHPVTLQEVINGKGNDYFAATEEKAILSLSVKNAVIATGGSEVYSRKAMAHLKQNAVVIYLRISFETMLKRIANITSRGILLRDGETIDAMFAERQPLYEKYADRVIDCDDAEIERTVSEIVKNAF